MLSDRIFKSLAWSPALQHQFSRVCWKLPHRRRVTSYYGAKLLVDPVDVVGNLIYYHGDFEGFIFSFLETKVAKYKRAVDVGGNIGVYTCYLASRVPFVEAFEPDQPINEWLSDNVRLNGQTKNVAIYNSCISSKAGKETFFSGDAFNPGTGSTVGSGVGKEVQAVTLDSVIGRLADGGPFLVKMDIEGAEWGAVQGASQTLARDDVDLLLEVHPKPIEQTGGSVTGLLSILKGHGYDVADLYRKGQGAYKTQEFVLGQAHAEGDDTRHWWCTKCPGSL